MSTAGAGASWADVPHHERGRNLDTDATLGLDPWRPLHQHCRSLNVQAPKTDAEMERLARQAFAVVWVNPLKGDPRYGPLAGGMRAAYPFVDRLVSGHDLASLEALGTILRGIDRRHVA